MLSQADIIAEVRRRKSRLLKCKENFDDFCIDVAGFEPQRHHKIVTAKLMEIVQGKLKRLMIFMPPGHAKSSYASVAFPPFYLGNHKTHTMIAASHTGDLAARFGRKCRNLIQTPAYREVMGFGMSPDSRASDEWETEAGGEYKAAGVGMGITGRRSDLGLIDDPVKSREEAESIVIRDKVWEWYLADFRTRLKPNSSIVIIQTRWHEDDLSGRILPTDYHGQSGVVKSRDGEDWFIINLPAYAEHPDDLMGRQPGELLWPDYYSPEMMESIRAMQTPRNWASLYQQRPRPDSGNAVDIGKLLQDGQPVPFPMYTDTVFAVIDTAVKDGAKHDGTAVTYYAYSQYVGIPLTILDWDIVQIEGALLEEWLPTVISNLNSLASACNARMGNAGAYIEDKNSGTILLQQASRRGLLAKPIESPLTTLGKSERVVSVSGYIHREMVKITEQAYNKRMIYKGAERNHLIYQLSTFRLGFENKTDDLVDTFTYGIAIALGDNKGF